MKEVVSEEKNIFWDVKNNGSYMVFCESHIVENHQFHRVYELNKNISYSIQYLEYLHNAIISDRPHPVVYTGLVKSFIITGVGVIESFLYYFLKSKGLHKTKKDKLLSTHVSNYNKVEDGEIKIETKILKKLLQPEEEEMTLDAMLKKVENKKMLGEHSEIYKELNYLRRLRNKVHLHLIEKNLDTDWHNFGFKEVSILKRVLFDFFCSPLFSNYSIDQKRELYDFL